MLISIATYNERENLPILVCEIFRYANDVDILVIDDNSPDGTANWVAEQMRSDSRLKLIRRSEKLGLGTATVAAMNFAIENGYDYLLNMDADLSHQPQYIPAIREKTTAGFDVVIGSRYVSGGGIKGWPTYRHVMSRCVNLYARLLLRLKTKDNSGSFRCYKVETLKKMNPNSIVSKGYSYLEEILYRLKKNGATFAEVPIVFVERRFGSSKINLKEAITALWLIFRIGVSWKI